MDAFSRFRIWASHCSSPWGSILMLALAYLSCDHRGNVAGSAMRSNVFSLFASSRFVRLNASHPNHPADGVEKPIQTRCSKHCANRPLLLTPLHVQPWW